MIGLGIGGRGIGLGLGRSVGAAAFVGAYDAIPNIVAAYGMRRLRAAYTGSLLRLRRSSDNAEQDIGYDGSGHLDTAAVATFIGAGSGYIVNWYDQSGNAYTAAQATAGSQPLYVASGQNGRPVGRWDGVNDVLIGATITNLHISSMSIVACVRGDAIPPNQERSIFTINSYVNGFWFERSSYENGFNFYNYGVGFEQSGSFPASDVVRIGSFVKQYGVRSDAWSNGGSQNTSTNATFVGSFVNTNYRIGFNLLVKSFLGDIFELVVCNAALSDANRQAAEAAANSYWAIY